MLKVFFSEVNCIYLQHEIYCPDHFKISKVLKTERILFLQTWNQEKNHKTFAKGGREHEHPTPPFRDFACGRLKDIWFIMKTSWNFTLILPSSVQVPVKSNLN